MEKLIFENDLKVFGIEVKTFPAGIDEAFNELIKKTGDCAGTRNYYGICSINDGKIIYKAVAEEKFEGEAEKYNYEASTIEKGEYLLKILNDWRNKTASISSIFHEMMQDDSADNRKPCVEGYKNDEEMFCMIRANN